MTDYGPSYFTGFAAGARPAYATKALALAGQASAAPGQISVAADESKDGGPNLYYWTGSALLWVAAVRDDA
jgi:hypothetical protein